MKKLLSVLLICTMLLGMMPMSAFAETTKDVPKESVSIEEVAATELIFETSDENEEESVIVETEPDEVANLELAERRQQSLNEDANADIATEKDFAKYANHPIVTGIMPMDVGDNIIYEVEPNSVPTKADRIYNDCTVYGSLSYTNFDLLDYYVFELKEKTEVTAIAASEHRSLGMQIWDENDEYRIANAKDEGYGDGAYIDYLSVTLNPGKYYLVFVDYEDWDYTSYAFYFEMTDRKSVV